MTDLGIDEFEDLVEIGRGGFGVVYTARQPAFDRTVAIKVLTLADDQTMRRFDRERQALGKVSNHPHITPVFASGFTSDGKPYLAMELMKGGSLDAALQRQGPMAWAEVLDLGIKLSGALETAHRAGILHRDLKPANVLLSDFGQPRLADFGIASLDGGEQTKTGSITASIAYAAPEVLDGVRPGVQADVYGLGATLFTLVAGRTPFAPKDGGESILALILRIARDPVPDLRGSGVPEAMCVVLERALAKSTQDRYPSAEAFGSAMVEVQTELRLPLTQMVLRRDAIAGRPSLGTIPITPPFVDGTSPIKSDPGGASPDAAPHAPMWLSPYGPSAPSVPSAPSAPSMPIGHDLRPVQDASPMTAGRGRVLAGIACVLLLAGIGVAVVTLSGTSDTDETTDAAPGLAAVTTTEPADTDPAVTDPAVTGADTTVTTTDPATTDGAVMIGEWQDVRPIPVARQQVPGVTLNGTIWVGGGLTEDGVTASVQGYEPATNSWRSAPDLPLPLHHHMSTVYDGDIVILGGWAPEGALVSAITSDRVLALQGTEWVDLPPLLQPRVAGVAVTVADHIVVTGGQDVSGNLLGTTEVFDGTAWTEVAPLPTPREHLAAATDGTWMYVLGGRSLSSSANLSTLERYDPATDVWETLPDMPTARGGLAAVLVDDILIAMGGEKPLGVFDDVEAYSIAASEWTTWPALPTGRHGLAAGIASSTLFTIGGALEASHSAPTDQTEAAGLR